MRALTTRKLSQLLTDQALALDRNDIEGVNSIVETCQAQVGSQRKFWNVLMAAKDAVYRELRARDSMSRFDNRGYFRLAELARRARLDYAIRHPYSRARGCVHKDILAILENAAVVSHKRTPVGTILRDTAFGLATLLGCHPSALRVELAEAARSSNCLTTNEEIDGFFKQLEDGTLWGSTGL